MKVVYSFGIGGPPNSDCRIVMTKPVNLADKPSCKKISKLTLPVKSKLIRTHNAHHLSDEKIIVLSFSNSLIMNKKSSVKKMSTVSTYS